MTNEEVVVESFENLTCRILRNDRTPIPSWAYHAYQNREHKEIQRFKRDIARGNK